MGDNSADPKFRRLVEQLAVQKVYHSVEKTVRYSVARLVSRWVDMYDVYYVVLKVFH